VVPQYLRLENWGFSSMNSTPHDEFNALAAEAEIEWPEIRLY
jgi:hypothetical protein